MELKVIYISFIRLTDKVARDWYINFLINRRVHVEFWDIVKLVRENHSEMGQLSEQYLKYINSYDEFENRIKINNTENVVYVLILSFSWKFRKPFKILSYYNCKTVLIRWGTMPISQIRFENKFTEILKNPSRVFETIVSKIGTYFYSFFKLFKPFDIVFTAGNVLLKNPINAKKIVPISICDFENYLKTMSFEEVIVDSDYAVFLDINLPYQSDLSLHNLPIVNPEGYYNSLDRFFSMLEKDFKINIVIAAHPKSNLVNHEFFGRKVFRMQTSELVKHSKFVLTHSSTALSYAVLNQKPVLFLYTSDMYFKYKNTVMGDIYAQSQYIGAAIYNIDDLKKSVILNLPDSGKYLKYKYDFLTHETCEHEDSSEIFYNNILKLSKIKH